MSRTLGAVVTTLVTTLTLCWILSHTCCEAWIIHHHHHVYDSPFLLKDKTAASISDITIVAHGAPSRLLRIRNHGTGMKLQRRDDDQEHQISPNKRYKVEEDDDEDLTLREEYNEESSLLITALTGLGSFLSSPTPGWPSLALGYPLTLLIVTLITSLPQGLLSTLFFVLLSLAGRRLLLLDEEAESEEGEEWEGDDSMALAVNLFALVSAIFTSSLLSPLSWGVHPGDRFLQLTAAVGGWAAFWALLQFARAIQAPDPSSFGEISESPERKLLRRWDRRFRQKREKPSSRE